MSKFSENLRYLYYFSRDVPDSMSLLLAGNNHLLTKKRLEDQDALVLFHTLKNNTYVTSLDLRYNNITDMGAELLANLALVRKLANKVILCYYNILLIWDTF